MSIAVSCSSCSKKFQAKDALAGKTVRCPKCQSPIQIPQPEQSSLGDLLDEELAHATAEPAEDEHAPRGTPCGQCGDLLPEGTRYCVVCGHNNLDLDKKVGTTALEYDARQQRLEADARPRHWLITALFGWFR